MKIKLTAESCPDPNPAASVPPPGAAAPTGEGLPAPQGSHQGQRQGRGPAP